MSPRDDATENQVRAADPLASTWLSANAGSGKTRVLTDRVARLLLGGTDPQRILCLTYTKAAASEMQNRLFDRLGRWAMLAEAPLRAELRELGLEGPIDADALAAARRLFARAIETPGGLKIQTIHSFCAALLRRFPLEAQLSPGFTEMDDRAARLLREEILEEMAAGADAGAVDALARHVPGSEVGGLLAEICRFSDAFSAPAAEDDILARFGLPAGYDEAVLCAETFTGGEAELLARLVPLLLASSPADAREGTRLAGLPPGPPGTGWLPVLEGALLTGAKARAGAFAAKIGGFPTRPLREGAAAPLLPRLEALMARVEQARQRRLALAATRRCHALHRFAAAFLPRYAARKAARGWLDFDDLIARAGALLTDRSVAQWVLFRLDGGIDHILVDEAQDTSPGQWLVIEKLADEFTAGEGSARPDRTLFVVGDQKQSIYSFQGADLRAFGRMQTVFAERFRSVGRFQSLTLSHSFRSSAAILRLVDATFDERTRAAIGGETAHVAFHADMPGRVDLWPALPKATAAGEGSWFEPVDLRGEEDTSVRLARAIAAEIRRMIVSGTRIPDRRAEGGARPMHEGDVLILVQRRSALFSEIIRACKAAGLEIAGADLLRLGGELAVRDLGALLAFLATPEDDLSLAAALRSPLLGWSEAQLYDLAQGRPEGSYLWAALRGRAAEFPQTVDILTDLRDQADYLRPYDLVERILTRHGGRLRLLERLGPEAEDGIDAFLAQALAFERMQVPSLTGFLIWLESGEVEVKRRADGAGRAIRVMTVHGAKGLEAPVVILPDTLRARLPLRDQILPLGEGAVAWRMAAGESPAAVEAAREALEEAQRQENLRLLYVAMTRAESWLIVCGAGDPGTEEAMTWYRLVEAGMRHAGAVARPPPPALAEEAGTGLRLEHGAWPGDLPGAAPAALPARAPLPDWAARRAPPPAEPEPALSPSALGGAKALAGEAGARDEEAAKRHGRNLHLLLEHLPLWPEPDWPATAAALLAAGEDAATPAETGTILAEARAVLTSAALAPVLAGALREVEITARLPELGGRRIHGTIDLLRVEPDRVLAIDYKSNAVVPATAAGVPEGILRQMGAYASALAQIYPGRRVELAVFWTATGTLMPLDPEMVRSALAATPIP